MERWRDVDLDEPRLERRVEQDVKAEEFEADIVRVEVSAVDRVDGMFWTDDRLDDLFHEHEIDDNFLSH